MSLVHMITSSSLCQSIWGSYFKNGKWGYTCCHSLEKNSYCLGEQGKVVNDRSSTSILETVVGSEPIEQEKPKSLLEAHQQKQKTDKTAAPVDPAAERERKIKEVCRCK